MTDRQPPDTMSEMTEDERNRKADEILAAGKEELARFGINFSGTDCAESPWSNGWLAFTDGRYYHRIREIMLRHGMGEGDVEMIIANVWEDGWIRGRGNDQD